MSRTMISRLDRQGDQGEPVIDTLTDTDDDWFDRAQRLGSRVRVERVSTSDAKAAR